MLAAGALGLPMELRSKLPDNPIEPPEQWAWGQHPNGLGYKVSFNGQPIHNKMRKSMAHKQRPLNIQQAPNDLLYKTCLATPDSPLCYGAATFFQCTRYCTFLYKSTTPYPIISKSNNATHRKSEEARKIKRTCMCAQHITKTDCNSIGAKNE